MSHRGNAVALALYESNESPYLRLYKAAVPELDDIDRVPDRRESLDRLAPLIDQERATLRRTSP